LLDWLAVEFMSNDGMSKQCISGSLNRRFIGIVEHRKELSRKTRTISCQPGRLDSAFLRAGEMFGTSIEPVMATSASTAGRWVLKWKESEGAERHAAVSTSCSKGAIHIQSW
jgi:hypothetical protein